MRSALKITDHPFDLLDRGVKVVENPPDNLVEHVVVMDIILLTNDDHKLAHGIDNRPVVSEWRRKSVSVEHTYERDLPDLASCQEKIPALIDALDERLARLDDDYRIHNCFLKMKFCDFNQTTVERQQTSPNYDDFAMLSEEAWQRGRMPAGVSEPKLLSGWRLGGALLWVGAVVLLYLAVRELGVTVVP